MQAEQQSERERFEAWATHLDSEPPCFDKDRDGYYEDWDLQRAWRGWQARAALSHPSPQWLPIESAPKDGTHILLANKAGTSEGGWLSDIDHGADWEGQIGMAGWWRADGTDWPNSHWMPLPAPPEQGSKG